MKNPGLAAVISLFIPGGGQMYAGYVTRGFIILGAYVLAVIIFAVMLSASAVTTFNPETLLTNPNAGVARTAGVGVFGWIVIIAMWIWQVYDAYNLARSTPANK
jgi:TM2 domain-containing membrane protein YozV